MCSFFLGYGEANEVKQWRHRMLTLPHRTIWTDAAISLFSTWQAILIRTYLATDCWWTHSFVFACVSQMLWCVGWRHNNCKDCSLSNNDQRQYSSWCLFNLLLDCYYSCSCCWNDAVAIMVCAHQADYRAWPSWISTNSPHRHVHVFCCGVSPIKQMSCAYL